MSMTKEKVIHEYYRLLIERNFTDLMKLFSHNAVVEHPIFDTLPATDFFKLLSDRSQSHKIKIIDILMGTHNTDRVAAYLDVTFITTDNTQYEEKSVHIFEFNKDLLIEKLIAVLDTFHFRDKYSIHT